jgi:hypothetical protein
MRAISFDLYHKHINHGLPETRGQLLGARSICRSLNGVSMRYSAVERKTTGVIYIPRRISGPITFPQIRARWVLGDLTRILPWEFLREVVGAARGLINEGICRNTNK